MLFTDTFRQLQCRQWNKCTFHQHHGSRNTANGYQALYSNTIGTQNTANGYQALYSNTDRQLQCCQWSNGCFKLYAATMLPMGSRRSRAIPPATRIYPMDFKRFASTLPATTIPPMATRRFFLIIQATTIPLLEIQQVITAWQRQCLYRQRPAQAKPAATKCI